MKEFCGQVAGWALWLIAFSAASFAQPARTGTASISGQVTANGLPLPEIVVGLMKGDVGGPESLIQLQRTTTDTNGNYQFLSLRAGSYRVQPLGLDYLSEDFDQEPPLGGRHLNLENGERVEKVDFKMTKAGTIVGQVTDAMSRPVNGTDVSLFSIAADGSKSEIRLGRGFTADVPRMDQTDERGQYRLYGLRPGRYVVAAGFPANGIRNGRPAFRQTFYPQTFDQREAKILEVAAGAEIKGIDISLTEELPRGFSVTARIVDAQTGQPVQNVQVSCGLTLEREGKIGMHGSIDAAASDAEGRVYFKNRPSGRHTIALTSYGYIGGPSEYVSEPLVFEIGDKDVDLILQATPGATLSGVATLDGAASPAWLAQLKDAEIIVRSTRHYMPYFVRRFKLNPDGLNPDGTFHWKGVFAGGVSIVMNPPNLNGLSLRQVELQGESLPQDFQVKAGEHIAGLRLRFSDGRATVRGQVKIINGNLPAGMTLMVLGFRLEGNARQQNTEPVEVDGRGSFVLPSLIQGEYELWLTRHYRHDPYPGEKETMPRLQTITQKIVVPASGEIPVTINLDLNTSLMAQPKGKGNQ